MFFIRFIIVLFFIVLHHIAFSQVKIGLNPESIVPDAALEIESYDKGVLLPRVQLKHNDSFWPLNSHTKGIFVYNYNQQSSLKEGIYFNNGSQWVYVGSLDSNLRSKVESIDTSVLVNDTSGTLLNNVKLSINHSVFSNIIRKSIYSEMMGSLVAKDSIFIDTVSNYSVSDTTFKHRFRDSLIARSGVFSSLSPVIEIFGDSNYSLRNVSFSFNDFMFAHKLNRGFILDSIINSIDQSTILSNALSNTVFNNSLYPKLTVLYIKDSLKFLNSSDRYVLINNKDSFQSFNLSINLTMDDSVLISKFVQKHYLDSLKDNLNNNSRLKDSIVKYVTLNNRFPLKISNHLSTSLNALKSSDQSFLINNIDSSNASVITLIDLGINDTFFSTKFSKIIILDSLSYAFSLNKTLIDSLKHSFFTNSLFKTQIINSSNDSAKGISSKGSIFRLNATDSIDKAALKHFSINVNDTFMSSKLTRTPLVDSFAYISSVDSLLTNSIFISAINHQEFIDSLSAQFVYQNRLSDSLSRSVIDNQIFRDSLQNSWIKKAANGTTRLLDTVRLGGNINHITDIAMDTFKLNFVDSINKIAIGNEGMVNSSIFEIQSKSHGVLFPRLNSRQRDSIVNPSDGTLIYNTTSGCFDYYMGVKSKWMSICGKQSQGSARFFVPRCETGFFEGNYLTNVDIENGFYYIDVVVTSPGTYNVYGTYNGIIISGNGRLGAIGTERLKLNVYGKPTVVGANYIPVTFTEEFSCTALVFVEEGLSNISTCGVPSVVLNNTPVINVKMPANTSVAVTNILYQGYPFFKLIPKLVNGIKIVSPLEGLFPSTTPTYINFLLSGTPTKVGVNHITYTFNGQQCSLDVRVMSGTGRVDSIYCDDSFASGKYRVGQSLDTSHYKIIKVNVIQPGTIIVKTDEVNGFYFFDSITANVTGLHTLKLKAIGTPKEYKKSTFNVTLSYTDISFKECSFDVDPSFPSTTPEVFSINSCLSSVPNWSSSFSFFKAVNSSVDDLFAESPQSIAISSNGLVMAIGAYNDNVNGTQGRGAVFVYKRSTKSSAWNYSSKLTPNLSGITDEFDFGYSLSISNSGDYIAVGVPKSDGSTTNESGAVYMYNFFGGGWSTPQRIMLGSLRDHHDFFGYSVSVGDSVLVVGMPNDDGNFNTVFNSNINGTSILGLNNNSNTNSGAAIVFSRQGQNNWKYVATIKAFNNSPDDLFGYSVALSEDEKTIAVGAPNEDGAGSNVNPPSNDLSLNSGAVYIYKNFATHHYPQWTSIAYIKSPTPRANDSFGASVSISSDGISLAVGAPKCDLKYSNTNVNNLTYDSISNVGAAYVYKLASNTWYLNSILTSSALTQNAEFGRSVAISKDGKQVLVGMSNFSSILDSSYTNSCVSTSTLSNRMGAAVHFSEVSNLYHYVTHIQPSERLRENHRFGSSVALDNNGFTMAIGAGGDQSTTSGVNSTQNYSSNNVGAAYIYTINGGNP